jgi:NAD(P)-binding Rossmann-like domain
MVIKIELTRCSTRPIGADLTGRGVPARHRVRCTTPFRDTSQVARDIGAADDRQRDAGASTSSDVHAFARSLQPTAMSKIIILGGSIAGLVAAYPQEAEPHFYITVLEAELEPGGRARAFSINGFTVEHGSHVFFNYYRNILALLRFDPEIDAGARAGGGLDRRPCLREPGDADAAPAHLEHPRRPPVDPEG